MSPERKEIWDQRNELPNIGNIGWLFGNWGPRPSKQGHRDNFENALRRGPAMVIGLAECQKSSEELLRRPGESAVADAAEGSLDARPAFQYLTIRGNEEASVLIGLRAQTGNEIKLLHWERRDDGPYKSRSRGKTRFNIAYTRVLVAQVDTDANVGFLGKSHNVMVVHVHRYTANNETGKFAKAQRELFNELAKLVGQYDVKVIMGDFNMAFLKVVPSLRSRGVHIELGAYYPWKGATTGKAMLDSCGIFSPCQASTPSTRACASCTARPPTAFSGKTTPQLRIGRPQS